MKIALTYLAMLAVFLALDLTWLGLVAKDLYRSSIGHLMADNFNVPAAVIFYLMYLAGVMIFAVNPAVEAGEWTKAALLGAGFGFFCYATYDLTNLATLKDWPVTISLIDMAWGTFLTGAVATAGYLAATRL
jgi:uncharacterized membrane protein